VFSHPGIIAGGDILALGKLWITALGAGCIILSEGARGARSSENQPSKKTLSGAAFARLVDI